MTKKSSVYTRSGDDGSTSLVSGTRLSKAESQISLYGDFDQLNSHVGYLVTLLGKEIDDKLVKDLLYKIQNTIFNIGSMLACEPELWETYKLKQIPTDLIGEMEHVIDVMDDQMNPLKNFILPGGTQAGAYSHICRTFCRKVERDLVSYKSDGNTLPTNLVELVNRFSDFLFVLGRYVNFKQDVIDVPWSTN